MKKKKKAEHPLTKSLTANYRNFKKQNLVVRDIGGQFAICFFRETDDIQDIIFFSKRIHNIFTLKSWLPFNSTYKAQTTDVIVIIMKPNQLDANFCLVAPLQMWLKRPSQKSSVLSEAFPPFKMRKLKENSAFLKFWVVESSLNLELNISITRIRKIQVHFALYL